MTTLLLPTYRLVQLQVVLLLSARVCVMYLVTQWNSCCTILISTDYANVIHEYLAFKIRYGTCILQIMSVNKVTLNIMLLHVLYALYFNKTHQIFLIKNLCFNGPLILTVQSAYFIHSCDQNLVFLVSVVTVRFFNE